MSVLCACVSLCVSVCLCSDSTHVFVRCDSVSVCSAFERRRRQAGTLYTHMHTHTCERTSASVRAHKRNPPRTVCGKSIKAPATASMARQLSSSVLQRAHAHTNSSRSSCLWCLRPVPSCAVRTEPYTHTHAHIRDQPKPALDRISCCVYSS